MLAERDYSYLSGSPDSSAYAHNILGVMDTTTAGPVCESFAEAFSYILHRLEIGNAITIVGMAQSVGGDGSGGHAWNLVQLGDSYYYVDSTWDNKDNTNNDDGNKLNNLYYKYFLVGSENTDFGAGNDASAIHWAAGTTKVAGNNFALYALPNSISTTDYTTPSSYKYLTDNGATNYGKSSITTADDYTYVFGKSNALGNQANSNLLSLLKYGDGWSYRFGSFIVGEAEIGSTPAVPLYIWEYDSAGSLKPDSSGVLLSSTTMFHLPEQLTKTPILL
jgi:hypothetical protein